MNIQIEDRDMPQVNPFGQAYVQGDASATKFFHYHPFQAVDYEARLADIQQRTYDRHALAEVIRHFLSRWGLSPAQKHNLAKFQQENSVVVVGGQQAGLLTGPLYTVYKAITILQLAKEKEEQLQKPVVPIFWVAGEDHDFQEVNHVFMPGRKGAHVEKKMVDDPLQEAKYSMSDHPLPKTEVRDWLEEIFSLQQETEFTRDLQSRLQHHVHQSATYVDFFVSIMHDCFGRYGLLMLDSADRSFRRLQSPVFRQIVEHYDDIDQDVRQVMAQMEDGGFPSQVEVGSNPALLFIYEEQERLLLEKVGSHFQTKDGSFRYGREELLSIAEEEPWRLSNNVITRPFMQESLFPTLAFVGGPGEIAYWALYRLYFERFGMTFPVVVPRISMTMIEKSVSKFLHKHQLDLSIVFNGMDDFRKRWLEKQDELHLEQMFAETKAHIRELYEPVLEKVAQVEQGMRSLGEKNLNKMIEQVDYLQKRSTAAFESKHEAALRQFDRVEQLLYPQGQLQERIYHPYYFLNKHGEEWLSTLMNHPLSINGKHKLIYLHVEKSGKESI